MRTTNRHDVRQLQHHCLNRTVAVKVLPEHLG